MSKNDQLRALREAKYARDQASGGATAPGRRAATRAQPPVAPPTARPARPAPAATPASASGAVDEPAAEAATDALCGHRNMGGRTCTREAGHTAKSHRYS
ncbi:hypothetical protein GCM10023340_28260 [Nocardioides marinquilinus]|uniref:Uncharacterized protein n=1 Tax=Nocardioides marinquilinus TaxID=1210400 RepID=A0ABP9PSJ4_9ACTN